MKLASTLTAVRWFFQGLVDESPHSLAFAIQHWGTEGFDGTGLPNALQSMYTAMSNVLEQLNLAQGIRGKNEGVREYLRNLKEAAYASDDLLSELEYYRLALLVEDRLLVEDQDVLDYNAASNEDQASTSSTTHHSAEDLDYAASDEDQASTSSPPQYPSNEDNGLDIVRRMNENVCRLGTIVTSLSSVLSLVNLVEDFQPNPHDLPVASHRITTSFSSSKQTVLGRDSERDQIIKLSLLPTPTSVSMIPIVGMGGIGKTTLARMVYNHEEIKKHFDHRIWVCVSGNFDVARLTREILEGLGVQDGFDHTTNVNELQELLMKELQSVRYLLVLDDVWNESEEEKWSSLCAPLRSQKGGSRLLMTTRLNTVVSIAAKNMDMLHECQLEGLPEEIYLSFFNICAFGDEKPIDHPSLVEIGKKIVGRLTGSPLAAKTVGGLLRENLDEDHWRSVLNSDIWQLPQSQDGIMPILELSYQHLDPDLQKCFTYCSVFPKNRQFEKVKLVSMWISHGYIGTKSRGNKSVEEIGSKYFDNLLSRSFIQDSGYKGYVLHDLLHDLAESVSENEHLNINWGEKKEIKSSVRHLWVDGYNLSVLKSCELRNLRTLIVDGDFIDKYNVLEQVLNGLKSIRVLVLHVESVSLEFLLRRIGHLIHLRYLRVDYSEQSMLLYSQWRPCHLQWISMRKFDGKYSDYIAFYIHTDYLVSLRRFLSDSVEDDEDYEDDSPDEMFRMPGIGKLTCLQELKYFTVEKTGGRKLAELKRLNELKGTLRLDFLENVSTKEEALEANLNKKVGIRKLVLKCYPGHTAAQMAEEVFEGLCPPPYIEELRLHWYLGVESPTWMLTVNCCLSVLQSLTLDDCRNWKVLPPLGQLPLLRYLRISNAVSVEEIGSSFYGSGVAKSFRCLETLVFKDMPEWVVWLGVEEDIDSLFPRLRKLTVMKFPKLKGVPMQCLASVEVLEMDCCTVPLAELENLTSLNKLILSDYGEVQSLTLVSASLVTLEIKSCHQLQSLFTTQTELPSLREITIYNCDKLVSVELKSVPSLEKLSITFCRTIQSVPVLPDTLVELEISWCGMLIAFSEEQEENLSDLTSLKEVTIVGHQLHSLPLMPASLQKLYIADCPELPRERYQEGGDDWHKISHVPRIIIWWG